MGQEEIASHSPEKPYEQYEQNRSTAAVGVGAIGGTQQFGESLEKQYEQYEQSRSTAGIYQPGESTAGRQAYPSPEKQ